VLSCVVVDYLQLLVEDEKNATPELASMTRKFKLLAKELNVPVIQLSQLNKRDCKVGERPHGGWLKGSDAIRANANTIIFIWREQAIENSQELDPSKASLILGKARGHFGTDCQLKFCTVTTEYTGVKQSDF
jgi:replicative DNA helicase